MKPTLSTLDLTERPHQRVWHIRRVQHHQQSGPLELQPGERAFAIGAAHHDAYVVLAESEGRLTTKRVAANTKTRF